MCSSAWVTSSHLTAVLPSALPANAVLFNQRLPTRHIYGMQGAAAERLAECHRPRACGGLAGGRQPGIDCADRQAGPVHDALAGRFWRPCYDRCCYHKKLACLQVCRLCLVLDTPVPVAGWRHAAVTIAARAQEHRALLPERGTDGCTQAVWCHLGRGGDHQQPVRMLSCRCSAITGGNAQSEQQHDRMFTPSVLLRAATYGTLKYDTVSAAPVAGGRSATRWRGWGGGRREHGPPRWTWTSRCWAVGCSTAPACALPSTRPAPPAPSRSSASRRCAVGIIVLLECYSPHQHLHLNTTTLARNIKCGACCWCKRRRCAAAQAQFDARVYSPPVERQQQLNRVAEVVPQFFARVQQAANAVLRCHHVSARCSCCGVTVCHTLYFIRCSDSTLHVSGTAPMPRCWTL